MPLVYAELHDLARAVFSSQNPAHTLQPTALAHEAWLKMAGHLDSIDDRRHFLVVAGKAMRQVIANHARDRAAQKRGGALCRVTFDTSLPGREYDGDLVDLDESLSQLAELRRFSGLSIDEVAETLGVSLRTVDADWAMAKAWLSRALR